VRDGDHRRFGDGGMAHQRVLQVDRADPLAAGLDEVLRPVGDAHVAVRVHARHVAGAKPAVLGKALGSVDAVIAAGDERALHLHFADRLAVPRRDALLAHDAQVDQGNRNAGGGLAAEDLVGLGERGFRVGDRADRRRFRHAPALVHLHAVLRIGTD
jgi:hypothetical protein